VEQFERWLTALLSILGGFSALVGMGYVAWRYFRRAYRVWLSIDHLHSEFGADPVKRLAEIIRGMEADSSEIELRQRITETHLGIGVYSCSGDGRCTWANNTLVEGFGIDSTEILGFGWTAAIDENDRERVIKKWMQAVKDVLPYKEHYRVIPPNGLKPWNAVTEAWPVVASGTGKLICMIGYVKRIPE
jgi:PAS domain-containing protein